jgi:hypothetical protein
MATDRSTSGNTDLRRGETPVSGPFWKGRITYRDGHGYNRWPLRVKAMAFSAPTVFDLEDTMHRTIAVLWFLAAILLMACVFEEQAQAQTATQSPAPAAKETAASAPKQAAANALSDHTKMQINVVDQAGKPIVGAKILASIWDVEPTTRKGTPNRDYTTDDKGIALVERPSELRIIRLWASHPDFVTLFAHWEEGEHDNGRLLPAEFTLTLPKGVEIGGRIIDEAGKPVAGVRVEATLRDETQVAANKPNVRHDKWLANGNDSAVSDQEGQWVVKNVPASFDRDAKNRVSLRFNHPNYIPIPEDGRPAIQPTYAADALRARTLETILKSGFQLEGVVRDSSGKPIAGALVIRGDNPYSQPGSKEVVADNEGRYRLPTLAAGKLLVTVVAKGWMPQLREIELGAELNKLDFQLEAGLPLKVRIVDQTGQPISKCYVSLQEWRGKQSLYNMNTGIPGRADEHGVYLWGWAPADAVKFRIENPGFIYQDLELTANGEQQTITLRPEAKISGTVMDASSSKPIAQFAVHPTLIFRKDFYGQDDSDATKGANGHRSRPDGRQLTGMAVLTPSFHRHQPELYPDFLDAQLYRDTI